VLETAKEVVFQMADVTQIDSVGVGALGTLFMAAHNREAKIKLAALHPRVAEVLRITNLEMLFEQGSGRDFLKRLTRRVRASWIEGTLIGKSCCLTIVWF
jgi:anti-anti-sigma regulatory factor